MKHAQEEKPDLYEEHRKKQLAEEAQYRRKFLAALDPKTREFAIHCFAQLGLHQ